MNIEHQGLFAKFYIQINLSCLILSLKKQCKRALIEMFLTVLT